MNENIFPNSEFLAVHKIHCSEPFCKVTAIYIVTDVEDVEETNFFCGKHFLGFTSEISKRNRGGKNIKLFNNIEVTLYPFIREIPANYY